MFSLIITVVAIALVAALALLAYYFAADTGDKYHVKAAAATLVAQSQQIAGAGAMATLDGVGWPAEAPHFSPPYLTSMPRPALRAYTQEAGAPAPTDWEYYMLGPPEFRTTRHFVLRDKIRKDVCMEVNRSQGFIGIPATWDGKTIIQCYGTADNSNKGYTFLYDPPGTTADDKKDVLDDTIDQAEPGATPGYPRLCPDGTIIQDAAGGLCLGTGSAPGGEDPPDEEEPATTKGYWIFEASVPAGWYDPYIASKGYSTTCPTGAVNPASSQAQPLITNPAEAYKADGIMDLRWWQPPDGRWDQLGDSDLVRTWCVPANPEDVPASWTGPEANWGGSVKDVLLYPTPPGVNPMGGGHYVASARATVTAGGVTWSMVAVLFETIVSDPSNTAYTPYLDGRKVAIGRGPQPYATYYDNVARNPWYVEVQNSPYGRESGTLLLDEPPKEPELWAISPKFGPVEGGTPVTISGANFTDDEIVYFDGDKPAPVISRAPDQIVVTSPPGSTGGVVSVTIYDPVLKVTTPGKPYEYKEDQLPIEICRYMGNSGPDMLFSPSGKTLIQTSRHILTLTTNDKGELPIRVQTSTPLNRGQEGFDKYISQIKGARVDGNHVPARTTLVSANYDGTLTFDAWIPASSIPTNRVPTIELETCGGFIPVSSFVGWHPVLIPTAPDECLANAERTLGPCTTTTVDNETGNVIATADWWLRGVFWTTSAHATMKLDTSFLSTAGNTCVPRAWQAWWWDNSSRTTGSGTGWVECTALYSEIRQYAMGSLMPGGTGSHSGYYVIYEEMVQEFYAKGGTQVPYLYGRQHWGYGGESIYSFPFHMQDFPGKANCTWSGCVTGTFLRYGTVNEFNAYYNLALSQYRRTGGTAEQALSSYACVHESIFVKPPSVKDSNGVERSEEVANKVKSSSCYQMVNYNVVPPM